MHYIAAGTLQAAIYQLQQAPGLPPPFSRHQPAGGGSSPANAVFAFTPTPGQAAGWRMLATLHCPQLGMHTHGITALQHFRA